MSQAIIFDMDGTLFQTDKILELSLEDAFNHLREQGQWDTETPIDQYREIMGVPLPKVWEALLPNHSIEVREQTDAYFLERLLENIKSGKGALYPNVKVKSIIEKHQVTNAAVVGDRLSDIQAAKDNGLVSIGCNFDFAREDELAQADMVIEDLSELKTVLPK